MHGWATFPGVNFVRSAEMTLSQGISPSRATLEIAPQQESFANTGTLAFHFGDSVIEFRDCVVDYGSSDFNQSGEMWRVYILDRRYKWAWGQISGAYNLRFSDGTLKKDTEKSPRDLAKLCLEAMDEDGGNVNDLPNETRPTVEWSMIPPAEALAQLCDMLGCRVVLGLDDQVKIVKVGDGAELPDGAVTTYGCEVNPAEIPGKLAIACGPSRFQIDFQLEAVGMDTDGKIKLIDDLSYKPAGGWGDGEGGFLMNVSDEEMQYQLAEQTVYRWYRIKEPIMIPAMDKEVQQREDVLPLLSTQCETVEQVAADETKILVDRPAAVYGVFLPEDDGDTNSADECLPADRNTIGVTEVKRPFSLDAERGIVMFARPIYKLSDAGFPHEYEAATLRLRTSCHVRWPDDDNKRAITRYSVERKVGDKKDPTRYVDHGDLVVRYIPIYKTKDFTISRVIDNTKDIKKEAHYYLDQLEVEYQTPVGQSAQYAGLVYVELDGAIQQVTWSIDVDRGTFTTVSRHSEQRAKTVPYIRRREAERQRAAARGHSETRIPIMGRWNNVLGRFE